MDSESSATPSRRATRRTSVQSATSSKADTSKVDASKVDTSKVDTSKVDTGTSKRLVQASLSVLVGTQKVKCHLSVSIDYEIQSVQLR